MVRFGEEKMAKFGAVVDGWIKDNQLAGTSIQCWTAMEEYFGVVPCTLMSIMSNSGMPSACEVDVCGTISMYALTLASETPAALLDWNNNYGDDPDKAVCFHCSNLPKHFFKDVRMDFQAIIAGTVGMENTYGTCVGRVHGQSMHAAPAGLWPAYAGALQAATEVAIRVVRANGQSALGSLPRVHVQARDDLHLLVATRGGVFAAAVLNRAPAEEDWQELLAEATAFSRARAESKDPEPGPPDA